ncbi:MAG: SDR family NAD(P)-dependent oxidoreductase [bacterium]
MTAMPLASRRFTAADQERFALLSGDVNPMHMDASAARRLQSGTAVVHGMHMVLWVLDTLARTDVSIDALCSIQVRFKKFVCVDHQASVRVLSSTSHAMKLEIVADDVSCVSLTLKFGPRVAAPHDTIDAVDIVPQQQAMARTLDQLHGSQGWLVPPVDARRLTTDAFPAATRALGIERIIALTQLSTLVGMVCPGLHSIFSELDVNIVNIVPDARERAGIGYAASSVDARFQLVTMTVDGSGISGDVIAFVRAEPVEPPSMASLTSRVIAGEFAGSVALIVGGSRGLGAVTAKLIAMGGGRVIVTYARGARDAEAIAADIVAERGRDACSTLQLDVTQHPLPDLTSAAGPATHLYYFATPQIFRQKSDVYSAATFAEFASVYLDGFCRVAEQLVGHVDGNALRVLNPSSVAVTSRPKGITEYAMAKAAAELLSVDLVKRYPGLRIDTPRLPRILTDQTATVSAVDSADAVETMLPLVRSLHAP